MPLALKGEQVMEAQLIYPHYKGSCSEVSSGVLHKTIDIFFPFQHNREAPRILGGWPFPSPGDLPNTGIKPGSPTLQADSLPSKPPWRLENLPGEFHGQGSLAGYSPQGLEE